MSDERQKEIALAAIKQYEEEENTTASTLTVMQRLAFEAGAKWADKHQDDGGMRKERIMMRAMIRDEYRLQIISAMAPTLMNNIYSALEKVNKDAESLNRVGWHFEGKAKKIVDEKSKIYAAYIGFANELLDELEKAKKEDEKDE
jgi:hypothetical protein